MKEIRGIITDNIGNEVTIRVGNTEKKTKEYHCTVTEVYRSLFLVEIIRKNNMIERKSFKYADVLTSYVEIDVPELRNA